MARQITTSACTSNGNTAALCVAYLTNGTPNVLVQDTQGVWSASGPMDAGGIPLLSLAGVQNNIFALDGSGTLYVSVFQQQGESPQPTDWSSFQPLTYSAQTAIELNPPTQLDDFSAALVSGEDENSYLVVVAVQSTAFTGSDAGFFLYWLKLSGATSIATQFFAGQGTWAAIAQSSSTLNGDIQFSQAFSPALAAPPILGRAPPITLLGFVSAGSGGFLVGWTCTAPQFAWTAVKGFCFGLPFSSWIDFLLSSFQTPGPQIAIQMGSGGNPLQAVVALGGTPPLYGPVRLYYDSSGNGTGPWASYGNLFPSSMPQQFSVVNAGPGNLDANGDPLLQVVALNYSIDAFNGTPDATAPFLMWQVDNGSWAPNPSGNSLPSPFSGEGPRPGVYPVDLAMGSGFGPLDGQSYLQVPMLGSDDNVYLIVQSPTGAWSSQGPIP
jgi:hypothetical protein